MNIKIESGIPMPEPDNNRAGPGSIRALLESMKVGDSFLYPISKRASIIPSALRYKMKVTTRRETDSHCRVWRVK